MATYEIPYQNLSYNLPDIGEPFKGAPGAGEESVFVRTERELLRIPKSQYQGNFGALPEVNLGSPGLLAWGGQFANTGKLGLAPLLRTSTFQEMSGITRQPETITKTISPLSPHGADITSSLLGRTQTFSLSPLAAQAQAQRLTLPFSTTARAPEIPKQVSILSSRQGERIAQTNEQKLAQIEAGINQAQQQALRIAGEVKTLAQAKVKGMEITPQTTVQEAAKFIGLSTSPAGQQITAQINQAQPEFRNPAKDAQLKQQETDALAVLNAARSTDSSVQKDALVRDATARIKQLETDMTSYLKDIETKRAERARLALPGEKEKQFTLKANEIKTEIDKISLANERRKFEEYEAQTVQFAAGRGREFDIRTGFETQERRLALQNVLTELGIEQGARGMQLKNAEQALEDFKTDFTLQQQMQDKINKIDLE